jgi:hypothetical protein
MSNGRDPKVADDLRVPKSPGVPLARVPFRVRFLDYDGKPLAGKKCTLDWRAEKLPGTTDADGVVQFKVPTFGSTGTLNGVIHIEVFTGQAPLDVNVVMLLQMPPANDVAGLEARLANLGYLDQAKVQGGPPMNSQGLRALDRFRFAHKLIDAKTLQPVGPTAPPFDAATKDRIEKVHDTVTPFVVP